MELAFLTGFDVNQLRYVYHSFCFKSDLPLKVWVIDLNTGPKFLRMIRSYKNNEKPLCLHWRVRVETINKVGVGWDIVMAEPGIFLPGFR